MERDAIVFDWIESRKRVGRRRRRGKKKKIQTLYNHPGEEEEEKMVESNATWVSHGKHKMRRRSATPLAATDQTKLMETDR